MDLVDWDFAVRTARQLVRPGPDIGVADAADVVVELRAVADEALGHVSAFTGLSPDPALRTSVVVVDRGQWAEQNIAGMRTVLDPVVSRLAEKRLANAGAGANAVGAVGRKVTATEVGGLVAFLASKVLGQYETFLPPGAGDGRLSLVAPNVVEAERKLDVDPHDFRLWVALHEQTHLLQFTGVPWMHDHLMGLVGRLAETADIDPSQLIARLRGAVGQVRGGGDRPGGVLAVLQSPEQRAITADAQAFMTVLEGHADYVMDAVGPEVVPSVSTIRERFEQRRRHTGSPLEMLLRRLLGFDAKLAQYRVGGAFFREVHERGGGEAVAAVWASPESLPTAAELKDPGAWLHRVPDAA